MFKQFILSIIYVVLALLVIGGALPFSEQLNNAKKSSSNMDTTATPNIPVSEMNALYDLYERTGGSNWTWAPNVTNIGTYTHTNGVPWNFTEAGVNPCTGNWQGLNCSFFAPFQYYHIAEIVLVGHNLRGLLPASIGNFTRLKYLDLGYNHLNGSLPTTVFFMNQLLVLDLGTNEFRGSVPSIVNPNSNLLELYLNHNQLTGTFPTQLAGLPRLFTVAIDINQFTGSVPAAVSDFHHLTRLFIDVNKFEGPLPEALCNMPTLTELHFSSNLFTGTIPACLGGLANLFELQLNNNALTGSIPPELTSALSLQLLYLHYNQLTGSIPATVGLLVHMLSISVHHNYLTGSLPTSLGSLKNLTNLYVENNHLSGTIPSSFGSMSGLIFAYLSYNHLEGRLPQELKQLSLVTSLFLDNNDLSGTLDGVFDADMQPFITTIELSNNQLTGTLPGDIFRIHQLSTFAAVSNCFTGSIPRTICNSSSLKTLILDGLRSASSCRNTLLPGLSSRYVLTDKITGGIPACLFQLPKLRTLHLSGNGLTGKLPDDIEIRAALLDVSISHNELTGTIPVVFQTKRWYNLDLSYNRLTGSLQLNSALTNMNATPIVFYNVTLDADSIALTLRNNRLSGNIPSFIDPVVNISVLDGNLFACNLAQTDLPPHDNGRATYQCGSNSFNVSYYVWIATTAFVIGSVFLILRFRNDLIPSLGLDRVAFYYDKWMHHIEFSPDRDDSVTQHLRNYKYVMYVCGGVCRVALFCTLFIVLLLLPIYVSCSHWYGTHEFEYAWSVSAAFLSGPVAMSLLLVSFVILLAVSFTLFTGYIRKYKASVQEYFRGSSSEPRRTYARGLASQSSDKPRTHVKKRYKFLMYFLFFLGNTTIVLGVNVAYVYIRLYQSSRLLVLAQLLLSAFKVIWNSVCSVYIIRWMDHYLAQGSKDDWKEKDSSFFGVQLFVSLFNYIAIPCLVVAVISPDCYQNVVINVNPVSSHFLFSECELFSAIRGCLLYKEQVTSTSYQPPFLYSYQCSSSLVTFYSPTFVYVSFIVTFINPLFDLTCQKLHQHTRRGKWWSGQLDYWVPLILQHLDPEIEKDKAPYDFLNPYFDANLLLVTNMTYLGVLLTFGVVFPPLAACLLVAIYASTYSSKLLVGRFTTNAIAAGLHKYIDIIEEECEGVGSVPKLYQSMRQLLMFSFCFYTPFLFDTLGDAQGLHRSFWVLFFLPLLVLTVLAIKYALKKTFPEVLRPHILDWHDVRPSHLRSMELPTIGPAFVDTVLGEEGSSGRPVSIELNRIDSSDSTHSDIQSTFNVLQEAMHKEAPT